MSCPRAKVDSAPMPLGRNPSTEMPKRIRHRMGFHEFSTRGKSRTHQWSYSTSSWVSTEMVDLRQHTVSVFNQATSQLSLAIPLWVRVMSTDEGYDQRCGRNAEFCCLWSVVTITAVLTWCNAPAMVFLCNGGTIQGGLNKVNPRCSTQFLAHPVNFNFDMIWYDTKRLYILCVLAGGLETTASGGDSSRWVKVYNTWCNYFQF